MGRATETAASTDFVVTTVNVPDRLDVQEVRARADEEEDRGERLRVDWYGVRVWLVRLVLIALVAAAGWFAWQHTQPLREELAPERIAQRLGAATGQDVRIGATRFEWLPNPRFVIEGLELGRVWRADTVSVLFNWEDAWRALQGGGWTWGEARVAPTQVQLDQLDFLVRALPAIGGELPRSISTVRFESIELAGPLLPAGPFEAVTRRQGDGTFGALSLRSLADGLAVNLASPKPEDDGAIRFQFDGAPWQATVGPRVQWAEVRGSGRVRARFIEISDFLLVGYFGSVKGTVYAAADQFWVVTGYAAGANLDVESMVRPAGRADDGGRIDRRAAAPFGGTVNFDLLVAGRGASFEDAVRSATAAGPFKVKWAAVNGINLGYAATRPGALSGAGGVTRFTDLSGWLVLGPGGASLQDMEARAGALATRGQVVIDRDGRLNGALRVDLGGTRVQAPLNLRVSGTLAEPVFGR